MRPKHVVLLVDRQERRRSDLAYVLRITCRYTVIEAATVAGAKALLDCDSERLRAAIVESSICEPLLRGRKICTPVMALDYAGQEVPAETLAQVYLVKHLCATAEIKMRLAVLCQRKRGQKKKAVAAASIQDERMVATA